MILHAFKGQSEMVSLLHNRNCFKLFDGLSSNFDLLASRHGSLIMTIVREPTFYGKY